MRRAPSGACRSIALPPTLPTHGVAMNLLHVMLLSWSAVSLLSLAAAALIVVTEARNANGSQRLRAGAE